MITTNLTKIIDSILSPVRQVKAVVELYNSSSTKLNTFDYSDLIKELSVERSGADDKFFGFGICQKYNIKLIDKDRALNITTDNYFKSYFRAGNAVRYRLCPYPLFYVTEVNRDELTNALSITAYDALYKSAEFTVADLDLTAPYTVTEFVTACGSLLGVSVTFSFDDGYTYEQGANFGGTETIRAALDAVAELTQSIYYIDNNNKLVFKRLDKSGAAVLTIDKEKYFDLDSKTNRRLSGISSVTELGDNLTASTGESGTTQYLRNNPFLDIREDRAACLDAALEIVGGLTINQFDLQWRGNFLLELGDKIDMITKDGLTATSFVLNDKLEYDGTLKETTSWKYTDNSAETASNPTNIGEAINQTTAKVDKINKQIELLVSDIAANAENIASLQIDAESITASVSKAEAEQAEALDAVNEQLAEITNKVEAAVTAENIRIEVQKELSNGVEKVTTATGVTVDESGITVDKTGSEMKTTISDDGMKVFKNDELVLTADNSGVKAQNLHATTYLIIGNNSRLEDYTEPTTGTACTGCFWIGG